MTSSGGDGNCGGEAGVAIISSQITITPRSGAEDSPGRAWMVVPRANIDG